MTNKFNHLLKQTGPVFATITMLMLLIYGCQKDPTAPEISLSDNTVTNYSYQIINEYAHDRFAFTQGLVYHNGFLYEGTGLYGQSSLRKVKLETGTVLQQINLDASYFGEGITIFEQRIYQLTWLSQKGFIYRLSDFDSLSEFTYNSQGWGITHNGFQLIMSDGTETIRFLDPYTLEQTGTIEVTDEEIPVRNLNELEFIEDKLFANVWLSDRIVIIDPETGEVSGRINLCGLLDSTDRYPDTDVLNGIAYDSENKRLFVTGKRWPKLFEIRLVPEQAP